jgi:hypothetical protein
MTNQTDADHASRNSEQVVRFISESELNKKAVGLINNGDAIGLYLTPTGNIRIHDVWNETHKATK